MWRPYHRLRTADTFVHDWRLFLADSVQAKAFLAFSQYVTHHIFKAIIQISYHVEDTVQGESPGQPLTSEEQNVLRMLCSCICGMEAAHEIKI